MTRTARTTLLAITIAVGGLVVWALPGVASDCEGCAALPPDPSYKVYVFEGGSFKEERNYGNTPGGGSSRYACFVYYGGSHCDYCGLCHTAKETSDTTYANKYDDARHRSVHFKSLTASLAPGQKLALGSAAHLRLSRSEIALTSSSGKDIATFPGGSPIITDRAKQPRLIALPPNTAPTILP